MEEDNIISCGECGENYDMMEEPECPFCHEEIWKKEEEDNKIYWLWEKLKEEKRKERNSQKSLEYMREEFRSKCREKEIDMESMIEIQWKRNLKEILG
jgi:hypothetical protein